MKLLLIGVCSLVLSMGWAQAPFKAEGGRIPGLVIAGLKTDMSPERLEGLCEPDWNCQLGRPVSAQHNRQRLLFDESAVGYETLRQTLLAQPGVQWVQPDYELEVRNTVPNDSYFSSQWSLELIGAAGAWTGSTGGLSHRGDSIVVAILDSGFDLQHPDLRTQYWRNPAELNGQAGVDNDQNGYTDDIYGWNFNLNAPNHPPDFHGTAVAGIIGARGNNGEGIAGLNWDVRLMPLTVRTVSHIIEAYYYALNQRKRYEQTQGQEGAYVLVTNASLGLSRRFCDEFPGLNEVYNAMGEAGILSVAATSNTDYDVDLEGDIPTSCTSPYLISVTNIDRNQRKVIGAAFGANSIDLGAPGGPGNDGVVTPNPGGDYRQSFGGTSAACPHVAGSAALLFSMPCEKLALLMQDEPAEAALLIRSAMMETTVPLQDLQARTVSGGRLDLNAAMEYLHSYCQEFEIESFFPVFTEQRGFLGVYPNPVSPGQNLQVVYANQEFNTVSMRLYNALGQLVWRTSLQPQPFEQQRVEVPTSTLQRGTYVLIIENGQNPIPTKIMVW
jgi:hypothetical protein